MPRKTLLPVLRLKMHQMEARIGALPFDMQLHGFGFMIQLALLRHQSIRLRICFNGCMTIAMMVHPWCGDLSDELSSKISLPLT